MSTNKRNFGGCMITKKQALEFIYNISQHSRKVNLNIFSGILEVDYFEDTLGYDYTGYGEPYSLEDMVKQFITENDSTQILQELDEIPVDIDMLKVGQKYKVHVQEDGKPRRFTDIFTGFDEEDGYSLKFENVEPCTKYDIIEIYKVNECIN